MKGFGYALERRWPQMPDDQRELMLRGIVHDADRMDQIVRQLVDAARVAAGALDLFPDQTDLQDLVIGIAEGQARDPEHPPIEWDGDPGPFFVDPTRMKTTILSFAESLVWWGSDGPIRLRAERRDGYVHVSASRVGADLDETEAEGLFVARRPGQGAGSKIGLYVARGVAEAQGGRAWAEVHGSELSFHIELPLTS
jgi:signal transduction histidine kinase